MSGGARWRSHGEKRKKGGNFGKNGDEKRPIGVELGKTELNRAKNGGPFRKKGDDMRKN